ncbi:MAG: OFA family MFS transporter, partial [Clostridia bacterium]|nr:OFA family MFS transporter [Clostridia bacterium]
IGSTQSGLPYIISLAFYAIFMLLTGRYLNTRSPRVIITIGGLLVGIGWLLSGFAQNIFILTITYGMITGAGVGIVYGIPLAVVANWYSEKKGMMVGLVLIGFGLSPFLTAPFARYLIEIFGVMSAFKILGLIFGLIIVLASYPFMYPSETESPVLSKINKNTIDVSTSEMVSTGNFKGLYINFLIGTTIGLMLIGMTSNVGIEMIKLPEKTVTLLMSIFAIFNGVGRPIFGWLTDKLTHKKAMLISFGLITVGAILMILAKDGNIVLYSIAFSIFWFNVGGWLAIAPTTTIAMFGSKYYSQNYGVVFTAYGIGAIFGVVSGVIKDSLQNYHSVFYFVLALCIIGIISSLIMLKNCEKEWQR